MRVLITDGEQPQTLAAVRALGRQGIHVVVGASTWRALSFFSRYCAEKVLYKMPPAVREDVFIESIIHIVKTRKIDVLLPIAYCANVLFSKYQDPLRRVTRLAMPDYSAMVIASDKQQTIAFAQSIGVATPQTFAAAAEVRSFPVVVKPAKGSGTVSYVNSRLQLDSMDLSSAVIQEYIPGSGFGFYGLFNRGELRAVFMHRRIREFPVTGGASTATAAYYDERLKELGVRLMEGLGWHGVAMVEMKRDHRDGEYKLMEINPKFWGSLDLAIAAGVNFPYLVCRMAYDGDVNPVLEYDRNLRFQWPLPYDLLHVIAKPASTKQFVEDIFDSAVKSNLSIDDWAPSLYLGMMTPVHIIKRAVKGKLFRPHGSPQLG